MKESINSSFLFLPKTKIVNQVDKLQWLENQSQMIFIISIKNPDFNVFILNF